MKTTKILIIAIILISAITSCEKQEYSSPVALFDIEQAPRYKFKVKLDASASFSATGSSGLIYRWDLNGDHIEWETEWSHYPDLTIEYPYDYSGVIGLQVKTPSGECSELYRIISTRDDYNIYPAYSNLTPDFEIITYYFSSDEWYNSFMWAHENIVQESSDSVFNFENIADQTKFGSLMTWEKAMTLDTQYKLPTKAQWERMIDFCGGPELAGYNLQVDVEHGLNLTCAGLVNNDFLSGENSGYYWTGNEYDEENAWALLIYKQIDDATLVMLDKDSKASVRLVIDNYQYFNE